MKKIILASFILNVSVQLSALEDKKQELQRLIEKSRVKGSEKLKYGCENRKKGYVENKHRLRTQTFNVSRGLDDRHTLYKLAELSSNGISLNEDQIGQLRGFVFIFKPNQEESRIIKLIEDIEEEIKMRKLLLEKEIRQKIEMESYQISPLGRAEIRIAEINGYLQELNQVINQQKISLSEDKLQELNDLMSELKNMNKIPGFMQSELIGQRMTIIQLMNDIKKQSEKNKV